MIPTAPECKGDVLLFHQERTVHKHINVFENLIILKHFVGVSGEQPSVRIRRLKFYPFQKRYQNTLVFLLAGFTAEYRNALYPRRTQGFDDLFFGFFGKRLTVAEIPCFGIVTADAVIPASGHEQRHTHTFTVGNIVFIQTAVIHRCITLSAISCVRP